MQLRQRRPGEFLPERRCGLPVELDVRYRVDGVVSEGPHVVGVGVGVGDVGLPGARGVEAHGVALCRVRLVEDIRRGPDVRGGAQARVHEAHHLEAALGLLWSRGRGGGTLRHHIHLEAALRGAAGPQRRFPFRHDSNDNRGKVLLLRTGPVTSQTYRTSS